MPFSPPEGSPREKILVFGDAKSGKTSCHLSIAEMYQRTNTEGTFYIIDTDDAMDRMLFKKNLPNIEVLPARKWTTYRTAGEKAFDNAKQGDWIVVDFIDRAWKAVRDWYFEVFLQEAPEEYFARRKKEMIGEGKGGKKYRMGLYDEIDWDVVNPEYNAFIEPFLYESPAHLLFICEEKAVWLDNKPSDKVKPGGQGGLPYQVHTIIRTQKVGEKRKLDNTMGGDRERPQVKNETFENFAMSYLVRIAEWHMA